MKNHNHAIYQEVSAALTEDIGSGDISATLVPAGTQARAQIITREPAIVAGQPWVEEVFRQLDPQVTVYWLIREGGVAIANQALCQITGSARSLLTGERCALNFLQTLSATATITAQYVRQLSGFNTKLLDTRKTLPGLRYAQKYAVTCAGGNNHRMGLYDAFLIKENHITLCGSISKAVQQAKQQNPDKPVEVEVENLDQFCEALETNCDIIMLDNFSVAQTHQAVALNRKKIKLEISGSINLTTIREYAATGVDFISVGAITKTLHAIDLSMRVNI